jgi:uncharacterized membrane protein YfcA
MTTTQGIVLFMAAALAGAINAVAGGGTLVTFPTLVWAGLPDKLANATSTVALWPGSVGGMWGYRRELSGAGRWMILFVPSLAGSAVGAQLLLATSAETFRTIVPYLILFATALFMLQGPISRLINRDKPSGQPATWLIAIVALLQAAIAVYGGYFGAGIGILMLSNLSLLRIENIHQMNGLKSLLAACINVVAATSFIVAGTVDWQKASVMVIGAILGGYGGATIARRLGQTTVRWIVVCIGLSIAAFKLYEQILVEPPLAPVPVKPAQSSGIGGAAPPP